MRSRICLIVVALSLMSGACARPPVGNDGPTAPSVVAAIYPLEFAAAQVGGEAARVEVLTPPGAEPHDMELTPGQVRSLQEADLIVYVGQGFQPAVEQAVAGLPTAFEVMSFLSAEGFLLRAGEGHEEDHGQEDPEEEGTDEAVDPHVWLNPDLLGAIAMEIGERLAAIRADEAAAYRSRAEDLAERLEALQRESEEGLSECERGEIVTSHAAFGYLADTVGLVQVGITGLSPESEPTPGRLAEVARLAREHGVTTIFFERLVSPRIAEALAREIGVETAVLDPLESPPDDGDYFLAMRSNLAVLVEALGCR